MSAKLLDQFVDNLEKTVLVVEPAVPAEPMPGAEDVPPVEAVDVELQDPIEAVQPDADEVTAPGPPSEIELDVDPAPAPAAAPVSGADAPVTERPTLRKIDSPEPQPVDLLGAAGSPVVRRVGPVLALVALAWLLKKLLSRKS